MSDDFLVHYGTPRHSGRYPWGSGENPYQRNGNFLSRYTELHAKGFSDPDIAKAMGMTTTDLRAQRQLASTEQRAARQSEAIRLKDSGMSYTAIGRQMGLNESTVRSLTDPAKKRRTDRLIDTRNMLKDQIAEKKYLDVGKGVNLDLGISEQMLNNAVSTLKNEGYEVINIPMTQRGTGLKTNIKVLCQPGTTYKELRDYVKKNSVPLINERWSDDTETYSARGLKPIESISSKKVQIVYAEDGGAQRDGVIELRRGAKGLDLGNARYAQVRIGVDGTHYLKGMAIYSDDLPDGIDIRFNTNKAKGKPMLGFDKDGKPSDNGVLKPLKSDPDNPFGSSLKLDENLHPIQRGYVNVCREEGDWGVWSKTLASQMLSKQPKELIQKQLKLTADQKRAELDEILALTNPAVKKKLLISFADGCDSDAVHLAAAAMPRQNTRVLLPVTDLKDNEIYAPSYHDGEKVVLIRYPHGGKFEIPELIVNNHSSKQAKNIMQGGAARDAICINSNVAARLSGADFDGDTALVIPNNRNEIKTQAPLKGLEGFNPGDLYSGYEGMRVMTDQEKQNQMGRVTNLITDMTLKGAEPDELARAVRHSMVVIDAVKHKYNWKQSEIDNGIAELKLKYQGHPGENGKINTGASTVLSRAKSEQAVPQRKMNYKINPKTGEKEYIYTGATYVKTEKDPITGERRVVTKLNRKTGEREPVIVQKTTKSTQMAEVRDARELLSPHPNPQEILYAEHANKLKAMANEARLEYTRTPNIVRSSTAAKTYSKEVADLNAQLDEAKRKKPYERRAQILANSAVSAARESNPEMTKEESKKIGQQALAAARASMGLKRANINITPRQWEAIQSGAISESKLEQILNESDLDQVKSYATPRNKNEITAAKKAQIKSMYTRGYSQAEIAEMLGVSTSTINEIV